MELLMNNWEYVLLGMYVIEKVIKLSPSKKDDVIFDMVLKPIFNAVKGKK
tara:strand:+ start:616 stop:765 length:150 start_codon:yes stop_codon:yes gene_type:complete